MTPAQRVIPGILEQIPVLIYAGDLDFICNWLGNQACTLALDWPGKGALNAAKPRDLRTGSGRSYGDVRAAKGLSLMQIYKAGHTVPEYEGEGSLDFLIRWMGGEWSK
jgi:cathepsin A (carboxypeptidase C)